ncbi:MAG: ABC transporter ATP-binding protein [Clostridiales bacterium]|nr:ABC transporter ATP-binding protein [Clostridiales bacterium]
MARQNQMHKSLPKAQNFGKSLGKLLVFIKPYLFATIVALLFAIASTVFNIISPDLIGQITTIITEGLFLPTGIDLDKIAKIAITLVVMYGCCAVFGYVQGWIMTTVTQKACNKLRTQISQKINRLPLRYFDTRNVGDVLSRVTNDVDTIGQTLNQSLSQMVTSVTMLIGLLIMMFATSWQLALVAVATVPLSMVLMLLIVGVSQKHFKAMQKNLGNINGHIEEAFSNHTIIKAFNAEQKMTVKFDEYNEILKQSGWKAQFMSGLMQPLMAFVGNLGFVGVCLVGGIIAIQKGNVGFIGVIASFMIYIRQFGQPLGQVGQIANTLQSTAAAAERVFEFLESDEMPDESQIEIKLENVKGNIEFKDVYFGYNQEKIVIKGFSAKIKAGQTVAIVGPTGAGKTTLVNLLMKFYQVNSGDILIDGNSINNLARTNVHDLFGMVLQDTWLFEGTIRDNVVYGKKDITDETLWRVLRATGMEHYVRTLPKGLDTILDDKTSISQGQRQLLTIARAMIENAPMIILDEATSSVDTRTEVLIQKAMDKLTEGRTSFIIAHRLSTIKNADVILVMKDGNIVEQGNHNQLIQQGGFYAELYNSQFENDEE